MKMKIKDSSGYEINKNENQSMAKMKNKSKDTCGQKTCNTKHVILELGNGNIPKNLHNETELPEDKFPLAI